ncbi:MAG: protein rep [Candidatus Caldarchaeum sp.]|nr:protein rep [Candidatus Caldarchaeum sp.]
MLSVIKEPVAFLTLTFPNFSEPEEAVRHAMQVKRRFYNFRLFGKKKWVKVKEKALELLEKYLENIGDVGVREQKRRFHLWTIERFEKMWHEYLYNSQTKFYMGRILRSIWKFEITYNPVAGWHPHWHVVVVGYFPLFVLQAAWVMSGGGAVVDIRAVSGVDAVSEYISKYEAKPVFSLEGQEVELPFDVQVSLEASLFGRKLFETWGLGELYYEEDEGYEFVGVARGVRCELEVPNLHGVPAIARNLVVHSRDGPVMTFLCKATVRVREYMGDGVCAEFCIKEVGAYLDQKGRIWLVGDSRFEELVVMKVVPRRGGGCAS